MSATGATDAATEQVAGFLERLGESERLVHAVLGDAPLRASITLRGARPRKLLLDFASVPGRIGDDDGRTTAQVIAAVDAGILHDVLRGALRAGEAFGRRQLLLRGSPADLARLVPLFDIAPPLYRAYLHAARAGGAMRVHPMNDDAPTPSLVDRALTGGLKRLAWGFGYGAGLVRYRLRGGVDLFALIAALSRGLGAATPDDERPAKKGGETS